MAKSKQTYEEIRQKRMEEINLTKRSLNLLPKPSPAKKVKPRTPRSPVASIAVRRSNRVADRPPVNYKDAPIELLEGPRRSYKRRDMLNRVYASDEERAYAIDRAEQIQATLEADFPSFVKPMLQSHVTGGFWLGLPVQFCKNHLPHNDQMITLEDENGNESETKYLAGKTGLSGGWRGFAIDHELVDGDALVFQPASRNKFKVYIVRVYDSEENEDQDKLEDENKNKIEENDTDSEDARLDVRYPKRIRASRK